MRRQSFLCGISFLSATWFSAHGNGDFAYCADGTLEIRVADHESGEQIPVRMYVKNQEGRFEKPSGVPFWKDHFVFEGKIVLTLPAGRYMFEIERGPEYYLTRGEFTIHPNTTDHKDLLMRRFVNMKQEGWWSGELHIHRDVQDIPLLMRAEDLHVGPIITWWNNRNVLTGKQLPSEPLIRFDQNRFFHLLAGEDEREGGALLYFNLPEPMPIAGATREYPSPIEFLNLAQEHHESHIDVEKPFWWDMPVWIASGKVDSIGLCHNHMWRDGMLDREAWGKPRDPRRYPSPLGNGQWTVDIYYQLLNCGLRIPPSAGSASGVLNNPVGYNRVYVYCGDELTYEEWWEGLRAGRVVVTNGPLLRPRVNGQLPGHVFRAPDGQHVDLEAVVSFSTRDPVDALEIVQNGQVVHRAPWNGSADERHRLPPLTFQQSGWMLVRTVTNNPRTYRFASSGPFYVDIGGRPRISKQSAQFFLDWVDERIGRIGLDHAAHREAVLKHHRAAREFWQGLVETANAD